MIYDELCRGEVRAEARADCVLIISDLGERGAEAVILGCTEIALRVREADSPLPVFDTTRIHSEVALDRALG